MALIEIDDRDVTIINNLASQMATQISTTDKYKEWMGRLKAELPNSLIDHIGEGNYVIHLPVITNTGSDVEKLFNIPFPHQLNKIELKHTDAANADSSNAMNYTLEHRVYPNLWLKMLAVTGSTASDIVDQYVDYYHSRGQYRATIDTTNTELLYIILYIRIMGV